MKECERYRDYLLRRSDLVIKFKKILCQKYLDSEEIYRLSESIMLIDSLLSRPPPLLSSSSSSPHYLLSSSSGAVASLLSLCVSPKRMLRPLLLIWMCTAVRGALESLCPDIEKSKFFVVDPCENGKYCEKPILKKDDKNVIVCNEDMEKIEGRNGKKNAKWNKIKELKCFSGFLIATLEDGNSKNFDYLQFRCIAVECQADIRTPCKFETAPRETCKNIEIDKKSKITCPSGHQLEVEQSSNQWTEINPNPEKFPYIRCVGDKIECKPVYKVTKLSQANFRCRPTACTEDPVKAFKGIEADCPKHPTKSDQCEKADFNDKKSELKCPKDYALEVLQVTGRWTEVTSTCKRSELTFWHYDGKSIGKKYEGSKINYRCRKLRGCKEDIERALYDLSSSEKCGLKKKCSEITRYYACHKPTKIQASFTKDVSLIDITTVSCDKNTGRLKVDDLLDIPMGFRCIKDATCEYTTEAIAKITYDTCETLLHRDTCGPITKDGTRLICANERNENMEIRQSDGTWMLHKPIDCYNHVLVDQATGDELKYDTKILRCREIRDDINEYFKIDSPECKGENNVEKRCKPPLPVPPGNTIYDCSQNKDKLPWEFEGKLAGTTNFIKIKSVKFQGGVFVMTEKQGTSDIENPYIPIEFRCIRDATCEVDLNNKYGLPTDCPTRPKKDTCDIPIHEDPEKKKIVCQGTAKVLEYTEDGKTWKGLKEIGCIGEKMTRMDNGVKVPVNPTRIRCRKPRLCNMNEYYDDSNCGEQALCDTPKESSLPNVWKCGTTNYNLQYKSLEGDSVPWETIAEIKCDTDPSINVKRFFLPDSGKLEEIPISFRCSLDRKCDLTHYYQEKECEVDQLCDVPVLDPLTKKLTCKDRMMTLRVKSIDGFNKGFEVVKSIECKDDKKFVLHYDDAKQNEYKLFPHRIQCVRMRSTTCVDPGSQESYKFSKATTWNGTTTVHCKTSSEKFVIGDVNKWNHHTHLGLKCKGTKDADPIADPSPQEEWEPEIKTDPELDELRKRKGIQNKICPYGDGLTTNTPNGLTTTCMKKAGLKCDNSQCEQSLVCETCIKAVDQTNAMVIGCEEKKDIMIYDAIKREKVPYENNTAKFLCERGIWQTETGDYFDNAPRIFCVGCADICKNCTKIPNMRNAIGCDNATQVASVQKNELENTILKNQTFVCKYGKWLKMTGEPLVGDDVGDKLRIDCIPKSMDPNNRKDEIKGNGETNLTWLWLVIAIIVIALIVGAVVGVVFMRRKKNAPAVVPEEPKKDPLYTYRFDPTEDAPIEGLKRMIKINTKTGEETCVNEGCIPAENIEIKGVAEVGGVTFHFPDDHKLAHQTDGDTVVKVTINDKPEAVFIGEEIDKVLPDSIDTSEIENAPDLNEEEEKEWKARDDRLKIVNVKLTDDNLTKEEKDAFELEKLKLVKDNAKLQKKKLRYISSANDRSNERKQEERKKEARKKSKESPSSGGSSGNKKKKETSKKRK